MTVLCIKVFLYFLYVSITKLLFYKNICLQKFKSEIKFFFSFSQYLFYYVVKFSIKSHLQFLNEAKNLQFQIFKY